MIYERVSLFLSVAVNVISERICVVMDSIEFESTGLQIDVSSQSETNNAKS